VLDLANGGTRTLATTALGAAPFVEEALRWLPESENGEVAEEIGPGNELIPVPCPPFPQTDASGDKRPVILVADDNADMRDYVRRLLAQRYQVEAVSDGVVDDPSTLRRYAGEMGRSVESLTLMVDDIDAWWRRAVDAGAEIVMPVEQMFWGARYGQLRDPFGVVWAMNQPTQ
jgi:hypothetical protein